MSNATIFLIFLVKILLPWAGTWSVAAWIYKLLHFGDEAKQFHVPTYPAFLAATADCNDAQWLVQQRWINSTIKLETFDAWNRYDITGISSKQLLEIQSGVAFFDLNQQRDMKARCRKNSEWTRLYIAEYRNFLRATQDCSEAQFFVEEKWVNTSIDIKRIIASANMSSTIYSEQWSEIISIISREKWYEISNAFGVFTSQSNTKAQCKRGYSQWVIASVLPFIVYVVLTLVAWWRNEEGWNKFLLLPLVLLGLYSQYKAIKIIFGMWLNRRQKNWKEEKRRFITEGLSISPMTLTMPSLIMQVALFSTELASLMYGIRPSPLGDNVALFLITFILSVLLNVMGLSRFLKDGPSPLICNGYLDGFVSKEFTLLFSIIILWLAGKCLVLSGIVQSCINLLPVENVAGMPISSGIPIAITFWALTMLLHSLIHSITVLTMSTKTEMFSFYINFPIFLLIPLFTPFVHKCFTINGKYKFCVSMKHTIVNIVLTLLLTPLTMVLFYSDELWRATFSFGLTTDQINTYQSNIQNLLDVNELNVANKQKAQFDLHTKSVQSVVIIIVILPYIVLFLVFIQICYLLRNFESSSGNNSTRKFGTDIKFKKISKIRWEINLEEDNTAEK